MENMCLGGRRAMKHYRVISDCEFSTNHYLYIHVVHALSCIRWCVNRAHELRHFKGSLWIFPYHTQSWLVQHYGYLWLPMVTYGYIISVCGCKRIRYLCFRIMGPLTVSDVVIWQAPDVLFKIIPVWGYKWFKFFAAVTMSNIVFSACYE